MFNETVKNQQALAKCVLPNVATVKSHYLY